ncbi:MAG: HAD family hydrolase [Candidatus Hodarchaeales archaeon]|jgi:FMN phosphatase YigB (HAD superfamily)
MPYSKNFGEKTTLLFDFDNTLLLLDEEKFVKHYFSLAAKSFSDKLPLEQFIDHMSQSTLVMASNKDGKKTNLERFLIDFENRSGINRDDIFTKFIEFYTNEFNSVKSVTKPHPYAKVCLEKAIDKNYKIVIATNPMFPEVVAEKRLDWAELGEFRDKISLITTGENSHFTKPDINYYKEILSRINESADKCLMIGNDRLNDGAASLIGIDFYHLQESGEIQLYLEPKFLMQQTNKVMSDKKIVIKHSGSLKELYEAL